MRDIGADEYGDSIAKHPVVTALVDKVVRALTSKYGMATSMREAQRKWDENGDGELSRAEFRQVLVDAGLELPDTEYDLVFRRFDTTNAHSVDIEEISDYVFHQYTAPLERSRVQRRMRKERTAEEIAAWASDAKVNALIEQVAAVLRPKYGLRKLRQTIRAWDTDNSGGVDRDEFGDVLVNNGIVLAKDDLDLLHRRFDVHDVNELDYDEFCAAVFGVGRDVVQQDEGEKLADEMEQLRKMGANLGIRARRTSALNSRDMSADEVIESLRNRYGNKHSLRTVFRGFDMNKDGILDREELRRALHTIGVRTSDALIDELFDRVDDNNDGSLQYDEFVRLVYGDVDIQAELHQKQRKYDGLSAEEVEITEDIRTRVEAAQRKLGPVAVATTLATLRRKLQDRIAAEQLSMRDIFRTFDVNHDGQISYNEYRTVLAAMGLGFTKADVEMLVYAADVDGEGTVDYEELAREFARAQDTSVVAARLKGGGARARGRRQSVSGSSADSELGTSAAHGGPSGLSSKFGVHPIDGGDGKYGGIGAVPMDTGAFAWGGFTHGTAPHSRPKSGADMAAAFAWEDVPETKTQRLARRTGAGIISDDMDVGLGGVTGVIVRGSAAQESGGGRGGGVATRMRSKLVTRMRLLDPDARPPAASQMYSRRPQSAPASRTIRPRSTTPLTQTVVMAMAEPYGSPADPRDAAVAARAESAGTQSAKAASTAAGTKTAHFEHETPATGPGHPSAGAHGAGAAVEHPRRTKPRRSESSGDVAGRRHHRDQTGKRHDKQRHGRSKSKSRSRSPKRKGGRGGKRRKSRSPKRRGHESPRDNPLLHSAVSPNGHGREMRETLADHFLTAKLEARRQKKKNDALTFGAREDGGRAEMAFARGRAGDARAPAAGGAFGGVGDGLTTWGGGALANHQMDRFDPAMARRTVQNVTQRTQAFGRTSNDLKRDDWLTGHLGRSHAHGASGGLSRFSYTPYHDTQYLITPPPMKRGETRMAMTISERDRFRPMSAAYGGSADRKFGRQDEETKRRREQARLQRVRDNQARVEAAIEPAREKEVEDADRRVRSIIGQRLGYYERLEERLARDRASHEGI